MYRPLSIQVWQGYFGPLEVILVHLYGHHMRHAMAHSLPQLTIGSPSL